MVRDLLSATHGHVCVFIGAMSTPMGSKSTGLGKSLPTVGTRVWLFSSVRQHVSLHRTGLVEPHLAHRTLVRLHSIVYQFMPLQMVT